MSPLFNNIARSAPLAAFCLLAGCSTETLFQSNFNSSAVGATPAPVQAVGTASIFGPAGSVVIAAPMGTSTDNWLRIDRPAKSEDISGMQAELSQIRPPGQFTFLAAMYIPTGSGLATIQFGPQNPAGGEQLPSFMHIDFMQNNTVRIDDNNATEFGSFPRNQTFDVIVGLNTSASPPTAHISLVGTGATGSADYTILPAEQSLSQQFGSVTVWQGYPWTGPFEATDLLVTHNTQ